MAAAPNRQPPLFIIACILFAAGVICLGLSFTLQLDPNIFKGLLYISCALVVFGIGEIINHPKQRFIAPATKKDDSTPRMYRKRNVCSLGNLCDIGALLLFFIGLAALFYHDG